MKKIITFVLCLGLFLSFLSPTLAYVRVNGYYRSNGTYVNSYVRSNPNGLRYDNYSYKSYQPLYNSSYYTSTSSYWNTPTYYTDYNYYTGKSLYNYYNSYSSYW